MRPHKRHIPELVDKEERLRNILLRICYAFDFGKVALYLESEAAARVLLDELMVIAADSPDVVFFKNYRYLSDAVFHLLKWVSKTINSETGQQESLGAAQANIRLFDKDGYKYPGDFYRQIGELEALILALETDIRQVKAVFDLLAAVCVPGLYAILYDPMAHLKRNFQTPQPKPEEAEKMLVVSVEFLVDDEPWANPQILKPATVYAIKGKIRVNKWPKGYDRLILKPISTENNTVYELNIPPVSRFKEGTHEISGHVVFKYPQHSFDQDMAIKLLCYFQEPGGGKLFPAVIGYDQLVAKVLDPNAHEYMTGFDSMSKSLFQIATTLQKELPGLDKEEKDLFLQLLRGMLNYQGFCAMHGVYKTEEQVAEDAFRDRLIQHLAGLPYLGQHIIKESSIAGGRVEISFKGLIAELKVEKAISDRKALIAKYGKQPVAYSSASGKQLSILCILDLTTKDHPPAPPQNNVQLITPQVHGFAADDLPYPPRQVVMIIDGNTKNPSAYSR